MSDQTNGPDPGNEAQEAQQADSRLLFARILERLDRLEKKIDSMSNNRPRPWAGGDNRRPGGPFNRPFKPNGFVSNRPNGMGRFDGPRGPRPHQGHGKPFQGHRPQNPR